MKYKWKKLKKLAIKKKYFKSLLLKMNKLILKISIIDMNFAKQIIILIKLIIKIKLKKSERLVKIKKTFMKTKKIFMFK